MTTDATHRQKVGHVPMPGTQKIAVSIVRTARLDDTLTNILERRLLCITLTDHGAKESHPIDLTREQAAKLRDLLTQALAETEGDPTRWPSSDLGALAA